MAVLTVIAAACGGQADDLFCGGGGCFFGEEEWTRVKSLSGLPEPPPDPSNRLIGNEAAIALGHRLYFDKELSGLATWVDTLERPTSSGRAAAGTPVKIACATCHDPAQAGADKTSVPGHVSVGAGWYDVNGQQSVNAAYYRLLYWNGRSDSLWGQAAAVMESKVSMNGNRLAVMWTVAERYRDSYQALVPALLPNPLPVPGTGSAVPACTMPPPGCEPGCVAVTSSKTGALACQPPFPLAGKPGATAECQHDDASEPLHDAFDCMERTQAAAVTEVFVNVAKLIGAYEYELRSRNAPFDRYVTEGRTSTAISEAARRGLRLFVGRASCIDCHSTPLLSDNAFHDIGVPQIGQAVPTEADCEKGNPRCDCDSGFRCLPWGLFDGRARLAGSKAYRRDGAFSDDPGKGGEAYAALYKEAPSDSMKGAWRTPSLRDVARTAPYMHDGVYRTLDEVVWHYDMGGGEGVAAGRKAPELKPLLLSQRDRADLVAFLQTLNGQYDRPALHAPPAGEPP